MYRMGRQQGPVAAQGATFSVLGYAVMEKTIKKNVYMYNRITVLYSRN